VGVNSTIGRRLATAGPYFHPIFATLMPSAQARIV
jgi:hypothetical protein